ncbi:MAG: hypothetical protein AAGE84_23790 [Cyanobacteria bacterium P01_G01_bin.39]
MHYCQYCYRDARYNLQNNHVKTLYSGVKARFLGQTHTLSQTDCQNYLSGEVLKYRGVVYQK